MSDYIEDQDYGMQLPAPGEDPFAYDWTRLQEEVDQAPTFLFGDITPASLQEDIDMDSIDWTGLNDALDNGPWRDVFDWSFDGQGMDALPNDRLRGSGGDCYCVISSEAMPNGDVQPSVTPPDVDLSLVCDYPACGKAFKRKGDLTRHKKLHERTREFRCTAQECKFSFTRDDKLLDHVRAGHDSEDLFACDDPSCRTLLTKDILPLHHHCSKTYGNLENHRQCPLPKCGFRVRSQTTKMNEMQKHLLKSHDPKGRRQFASLLASRGYDHESANILCPICPGSSLFTEHIDYALHFWTNHCPGFTMGPLDYLEFKMYPGHAYYMLQQQKKSMTITDEQRKHCRTILSLVPGFLYHPIWDDIRTCNRS